MRFILAFLVAIFAQPVLADTLPALYDVTGVASDDVLNVRQMPDAASEIVDTLTPDETHIEIVALSDDGRWGQLNMSESSGWASMAYLGRQAGQDGNLAFPFSCYGTEPFWSLSARHESDVTFTLAEGVEAYLTSASISRSSNLINVFGLTASSPGDRISAIIKRESCGDGMSDRAFGLSVHTVRRDGTVYSGCCLLAP